MTIDQQIQETEDLKIVLEKELKECHKKLKKHFEGMEEGEQERILSLYWKGEDGRKKLKSLIK